MDEKFLKKKGLLKEVKRFNYIMEYVSGMDRVVDEVDGNGDGLDDATGLADPMAGGAAPMGGPNAMGGAPATDMNMDGMPDAAPMGDPNAMGAAPAAGAQGAPGFDPQQAPATAQESFDEATPDGQPQDAQGAEGAEQGPEQPGGEEEEVIDVGELVDGQKRNEEAIGKLTDKFERFLEKFSEFQGELKSNAEFMENLQSEFEKRNPTSVERLSMRSLQSKPFQETPEEYMKYDAPENYSPEDDRNGAGEPRYTITRDDVRNATDYSSIAKTLRDNENSTLKTLLGF